MSSLVIGLIIFFLIIGLCVAWVLAGAAIKMILLWGPPAGAFLVGSLISYLISGIVGGFLFFITLISVWAIYDHWEYSDLYNRWIEKIDQKFLSK